MDAPHLKTALPGPEGQGHHRARRPGRVAVLHARLSVRDRPRQRRHRRGRRRQRVPRLRRRHRRQLDRPRPPGRWSRRSSTRRRSSCTCRAPTSTTSRRSRLGEEMAAHRAVQRPEAHVLRQLRHRGQRGGDQAGALSHQALRHHRLPRQLPRPHAGIAVADLEPGDPAPGVRTAGGRHLPRALRQLLSLPGAARRPRPAPASA